MRLAGGEPDAPGQSTAVARRRLTRTHPAACAREPGQPFALQSRSSYRGPEPIGTRSRNLAAARFPPVSYPGARRSPQKPGWQHSTKNANTMRDKQPPWVEASSVAATVGPPAAESRPVLGRGGSASSRDRNRPRRQAGRYGETFDPLPATAPRQNHPAREGLPPAVSPSRPRDRACRDPARASRRSRRPAGSERGAHEGSQDAGP